MKASFLIAALCAIPWPTAEVSEGGWIFKDGQFIPQEVTQTASPVVKES